MTTESWKHGNMWHAWIRENGMVIHTCVRNTQTEAVSAVEKREPMHLPRNNLACLPPHVMIDVVSHIKDKYPRLSHDEVITEISILSAEEIIDAYLTWNGIIGYTGRIIDLVHSAEKCCKTA